MEQLKEKVRELRKRRGWSQEDLAREIMLASPGFNVGRRRGAKPTRLARRELERLFQEAGINGDEQKRRGA